MRFLCGIGRLVRTLGLALIILALSAQAFAWPGDFCALNLNKISAENLTLELTKETPVLASTLHYMAINEALKKMGKSSFQVLEVLSPKNKVISIKNIMESTDIYENLPKATYGELVKFMTVDGIDLAKDFSQLSNENVLKLKETGALYGLYPEEFFTVSKTLNQLDPLAKEKLIAVIRDNLFPTLDLMSKYDIPSISGELGLRDENNKSKMQNFKNFFTRRRVNLLKAVAILKISHTLADLAFFGAIRPHHTMHELHLSSVKTTEELCMVVLVLGTTGWLMTGKYYLENLKPELPKFGRLKLQRRLKKTAIHVDDTFNQMERSL